MTLRSDLTPRCPGTLSRRAFLRSGLLGLGSLSLAELLRFEGRAASPGPASAQGKSIIVLWLWGGPSHMETFDLKPEAPIEYRGDFRPIRTKVPGIAICEHLPRLARLADKYALIRSCHHDSPGHVNSTHTLTTGYPGELIETPPFRPKHPDFYAVAVKLLGERASSVPPFVALPRTRYTGAAYLGNSLDPLVVTADPNGAAFQVPSLGLQAERRPEFSQRLSLLEQFDNLRRDLDSSGLMSSLDSFQQRAVSLLTGDAARKAFALETEDPKLRDR
jgi:hypothetical protein